MTRHKKPHARSILSSRTTILLLLLVLILISWAVYNNFSKSGIVNQQSNKLKKEIDEIEKQNSELASLLDYFASNEYIEKEAREKLNLGQPGEKVVIIPESEDKIADLKKNLDKKNSPALWWSYFFEK